MIKLVISTGIFLINFGERKENGVINKHIGKISKFINEHGEKDANIVQVKSGVDKRTCLFIRKVSVTYFGSWLIR